VFRDETGPGGDLRTPRSETGFAQTGTVGLDINILCQSLVSKWVTSKSFEVFLHIVVASDRPQGGDAALQAEDHPRVPPNSELKVISLQPAYPESTVQVRFAKCIAQIRQCLLHQCLPFIWQVTRLCNKARSKLNF